MHNFIIDPDAKCKIALTKQFDANSQPYYIGKLQMPVIFDFKDGASMMVFVSDEGVEELHIAPLDPNRSRSRESSNRLSNGRFEIDLHPMEDQHSNIYYIGEAQGPVTMDLKEGIFFTVFTSRSGEEQLQISKLQHRRTKKAYRKDVEVLRGPRRSHGAYSGT